MGGNKTLAVEIPLFGKHGMGKFALVDAEDAEKVAGIRWHVNDAGYALNRSRGKTTRMHRLVNNTPVGLVTDHLNGSPLDNRKANLRSVTQKENAKNRHKTAGYCWDASKNKWVAYYRGKFYGRYATEVEAKKAYRLACSGVPYKKSRRKFWYLPAGVTRQFGKYRVCPQKDGVRYWLGAHETIDEAVNALKIWQRGG